MSKHHFFIPPGAVNDDGFVIITGQDARHIGKVLRLRTGDIISVSDGESRVFEVMLTDVGREEVKGTATRVGSFTRPKPDLTVWQGLPKSRKMDLIVEKLTEIGVDKIVPVNMRRSVAAYQGEREHKRVERWRDIVLAAAKQSRRMTVPEVAGIAGWDDALRELPQTDVVIIPWEGENTLSFDTAIRDWLKPGIGREVALFIGPEGGFEDSEIADLRSLGGLTVSLGRNILRTETAGLVASTLFLNRLNRLG